MRRCPVPGGCLYLAGPVELVGQLDLAEGDALLHPVRPEVGRVRVDVGRAGRRGVGLTARYPLAVHVLPAVLIGRGEVQEDGVHGVGVQTAHGGREDGEHPPGERGDRGKFRAFTGQHHAPFRGNVTMLASAWTDNGVGYV